VWRKFLLIGIFFGAIHWPSAEAVVPEVEQDASRRVALVVGNGAYAANRLSNPANDARAVGRALRALGFEVLSYEDASGQRMREALREFRQRLGAGGVGLFYFAGHGVRIGERTLLLPVDAASRLSEAIDLDAVLGSMSAARPGKLNLIVLDTCLSKPFQAGPQELPALPEQTLIAYATAPGSFAADGPRYGLYTAAWLKAMAVPGRRVGEVFESVRVAVARDTQGRQIPWLSSSLSSESAAFRLVPPGQVAPLARLVLADDERVVVPHSRGILPKDSAEQYELTFWESIKDSNFASDYQAYLQAYPNGRFAALAKARIERLRAAAAKTETPAEHAQPAPVAKPAPERTPPVSKPVPERVPPSAVKATPVPAAVSSPTGRTPALPVAGLGEVKDCPTCPALIAVPRGAFTMGSNADDPSEKPAHHVSIAESFAIAKYEVSVEQWTACVEAGACPRIASMAGAPATAPARDVSWDDVEPYVKWLSKISGKTYRLPTEAEWEYAARGGTSTRYWWGEQMRSGNANCKGCGEPWQQEGPAKVGSFAANPYGLYDMNGSVWEWVADCWHNSYQGAPADGRAWNEANCRVRVIRGGSWREGANYMLSSTRFKYDASVRHSQNGFRVARDVK